MENVIKRIVKYILDSKYKDFEDVIVTKHQPTYADMDDDAIYYNVYCVIDGKKYFGGDLDWAVVRDSIISIIRMSGINNSVNIYLRFSDEK
jgi:hypothetical protein